VAQQSASARRVLRSQAQQIPKSAQGLPDETCFRQDCTDAVSPQGTHAGCRLQACLEIPHKYPKLPSQPLGEMLGTLGSANAAAGSGERARQAAPCPRSWRSVQHLAAQASKLEFDRSRRCAKSRSKHANPCSAPAELRVGWDLRPGW